MRSALILLSFCLALTASAQQLTCPLDGGLIANPISGGATSQMDTIHRKGIEVLYTTGNCTDVVAVAPGRVVSKFLSPGERFALVVLDGDSNLCVYGLLDTILPVIGDTITSGDILGTVCKGDHDAVLHFEMWQAGKAVNIHDLQSMLRGSCVGQ